MYCVFNLHTLTAVDNAWKRVRNIKHHCYQISDHKEAGWPWQGDLHLGDLHWQRGWLDPDQCRDGAGGLWIGQDGVWRDGAVPPSSCSTPSPSIRGLLPLHEWGGKQAADQVCRVARPPQMARHLALHEEAGCRWHLCRSCSCSSQKTDPQCTPQHVQEMRAVQDRGGWTQPIQGHYILPLCRGCSRGAVVGGYKKTEAWTL